MTKSRGPKNPDLDALGKESNALLARPLATPACRPPDYLELADDRLIYAHVDKRRFELNERVPDVQMLLGFAALADAEPTKILAFAKRWGVLGVCRHDMSLLHAPPLSCLPRELDGAAASRRLAPPRKLQHTTYLMVGTFWEPISLWRSRALSCRLLLETASACRRGKLTKNALTLRHEQARELLSNPFEPDDLLAWQRLAVSSEINIRMAVAGVRPQLSIREDGSDFWFGYEGLDGAIATLLFSAVAGRSFGLCSGCGQIYEPVKRPREGEQQWCAKCRGRGMSRAAAAKAYRNRKQLAFELQARGKSLSEIAIIVDRPQKKVRAWLEPAGRGATRRKGK